MDPDAPQIDPRNELLSECIVQIHISVRDVNQKLMRSGKKYNYITPRDFLDFINHFISLKEVKQAELVELQGHLNRGLDKLKETEEEVAELQKSLTVYKSDLMVQEKAAQAKLVSMLDEQRHAEKQKDISERTAKELVIKQAEIAERKVKVDGDLSKAEPALIAAQDSVSGIRKDQLGELRSYAKPPELVKLTLEPVMCLISRQPKAMDWKGIKGELRKDDFIKNIMDFDKNDITHQCKKFVLDNYLRDTVRFDPAKIMKASKAAGPLAMWVKSIVEYSEIFHSIEPLRKELLTL